MTSALAAVRVRRMTPADVEQVLALAGSLPSAPQWPRAAYLAVLNPQAALSRVALVAEEQKTGAVVGFAVASLLAPEAELESIAVASGHQRRGLAGRLFANLSTELQRAGAVEIFLEVRASNFPALALYRTLGFAETGRRRRYYHDPVEDALLMRLRIL